jgi:hypothetical protein
MRLAVVISLAMIVALLVVNLKYKALMPSVATQLFSIEKVNSPPQRVVKVQPEVEAAYNKDLTNVRKNGVATSLSGVDLSKWTVEQLLLTVHSYTDNTDVVCERKIRMGNIGDGGWEICDDPDVRPRQPCIIYSFGINYDFSFDDDAAQVYGCDVYCFDPSMAKEADKVERSKLVHFYKIGLSHEAASPPKGWKLQTLGGIRAMLGHKNKTIDVLKIDIESGEWNSIPEMVKTGQLKDVRQILFEYHFTEVTKEYLLPRLQAIQSIEEAGFKRFYAHKNPACGRRVTGFPVIRTICYELYYIRRS